MKSLIFSILAMHCSVYTDPCEEFDCTQERPAIIVDCEAYGQEYASFANGNPVIAYNVRSACKAAQSVSGPWPSYDSAQSEADTMDCAGNAFVQTPDEENFFHVLCTSEVRPAFISESHWMAAECDGYGISKATAYCAYDVCDDNGQAIWELHVALCEASSVTGTFADRADARSLADKLDASGACPGVPGEWSPGTIVESMADDTIGPWLVFCPGA